MILYFSATGNTRFVARRLAALLDDAALDLLDRIRRRDYSPIHSEKPFVICAPVYVCELPRFFAAFLRRVALTGSRDAFFVFTSGGYAGISGPLARSIVRRKGMRYMGCAELTMPRNYIANNWYPELETNEIERRIRETAGRLQGIADSIKRGEMLQSRRVRLFEKLVTLPFNPVWCRFRQGVGDFHVTDACVGCGKCARGCPLNVIEMVDGRPVWKGKTCAHCMGCIQNCPAEAIEYGQMTQKKARYRFDKYESALAEQGGDLGCTCRKPF